MVLRSTNPYTGLPIEEFEEFSDQMLNETLIRSADAFEKWKVTDHGYRRLLLKKVAVKLNENKNEYSAAITMEMGKPVRESLAEVEKCAWVCEYYAENAGKYLTEEIINTDADLSYVSYDPLGVVLGIMPWNFPFWQVFRFAVPTLMAGNTVLLKHASNVQICAHYIENIFSLAGFPPYVFSNIVLGSGRANRLIENDIVKAVSLTGSEYAGQKVAEAAGRNIRKSLLELGGSNAFIVLDDADIDKAADIGLRARMMNAGQSCIAAKRFIIHEKVGKQFTDLFLDKLKKLKQGDPMLDETDMGPLSSVTQAESVEDQVNRSVAMGATIIYGGKREKAFFSPTLVGNVKPGMPLFDEEVFGPVAPITLAKDTNEAVLLAKSTKFGLGVSVFTNDTGKARELAKEFNDGAVFFNDLVKSDPRLPFGGTGRSGYGRELSINGIREFVNIKTIYIKKT